MVVLQEKDGDRTAERPVVQRRDLLPCRAKQSSLVVTTQNRCSAIKMGISHACFGPAQSGSGFRCKEIPVDVVPICNECVGREGERSLQQFSANRGRQELKAGFCREENIVSAGAGINQQPKLRRQLIQSRHCGQGPWLAQTATVRGGERRRFACPALAGTVPIAIIATLTRSCRGSYVSARCCDDLRGRVKSDR